MKSFLSYSLLGLLVVACSSSVQRPMFFPGTGTHDVALDCAETVLEDDGFLTITREQDAGVLSAERGRDWLYVSVIPHEPLVYTMQVVATEGARNSASDIALRCGD